MEKGETDSVFRIKWNGQYILRSSVNNTLKSVIEETKSKI